MSDYIFDNINSISNTKLNNDIFNSSSIFSFDDECLKSLQNNHRESYKDLAKRYIKKEQLFDIESYKNDYIILNNCFVNNNGVILTSDKKRFINGACLSKDINYLFKLDINKNETVISITTLWGGSIWHFPFESFVALMSIPKDILNKSKIHVPKISNYIIQWLNFLNIQLSQLITGDIYANTLYIPRQGKCGRPYYSQVKWLKNIINDSSILNFSCDYMILIKRNSSRKLQNYNELEILLKTFCNKFRLNLYIHDDNNLPSLLKQQEMFSKAKIVFAPHGAGGINIIAMKEKSWYIEFICSKNINVCYSRLAYLCNINYKGISMTNSKIDLKKVNNILLELQSTINY